MSVLYASNWDVFITPITKGSTETSYYVIPTIFEPLVYLRILNLLEMCTEITSTVSIAVQKTLL